MSYTRTRNMYDPALHTPFKLSRSKIDLFIKCPRCFYLDRRLGIGQPQGPAFTLNSAVDTLLKKEFDVHRANGTKHALMERYGLEVVPFAHDSIDQWRENFVGVQHHHEPTNFIITGAVDDVWLNKDGELHVVDYKATAKNKTVDQLDDSVWHDAYRRQMEIYQWLLRQNGFPVSDTGYFVYVNGQTDRLAFDGKLEFEVHLIPYIGSAAWIEQTLSDIYECLTSGAVPDCSDSCDHCQYFISLQKALATDSTFI